MSVETTLPQIETPEIDQDQSVDMSDYPLHMALTMADGTRILDVTNTPVEEEQRMREALRQKGYDHKTKTDSGPIGDIISIIIEPDIRRHSVDK